MKQISVLSPGDREWSATLAAVPHDIYHLPAYAEAEEISSSNRHHLIVVREGESFIAFPLSLRELGTGWFDASSPYGYASPLASRDAPAAWKQSAVQAVIEHLAEMRVVSLFLRFHPFVGMRPSEFRHCGQEVQQGTTVSMALGRPYDEVRAEMRKEHRYKIRKALRMGVTAKRDAKWEHFEDFLEIYRSTMDRVGATRMYYFPRAYFEHLRDGFDGHFSLWVAQFEGITAAASLISICGDVVQYHLSGTHRDFLARDPMKVLLDSVAQWANDRGHSHFHLGGGLGGQEDSLFGFKSGFSKRRHDFSTVRLVVNRERFRRLTDEWEEQAGCTSNRLTGYFPPYRSPIPEGLGMPPRISDATDSSSPEQTRQRPATSGVAGRL